MPVRRSLGDSGADAAGRKVRGSSKGSGDDVRTPRSKSTNVDKSHRKVRVAIEGSNGGGRTIVAEKKGSRSNGGDRTTVAEKKGSRKVQRRGDGDDVASYLGVNENSSEGRSGRKRDFKMKTGSEGFEAVIDGSSGRKRKRIHADPGMVEDRMSDGIGRKFTSKSRYDMAGSYMDKDKKVPRRKDGEFKDSDRNGFVKEMTKFRESESQDKKVRRSKTEGDDKQKIFQDNGLGNGKTKISSKKKVPLATQKEGLNQRRNEVDSAEKLHKKKNHGKKSLGADSDLTEGRPKKKKRVIRIDPYDISNKRLDDSIAGNGNSKAKMDSTEPTGGEMSQNAQFRAICPSSSILSFVEDNLLGRRRDIEFRRAGYNIELSAPLDNIPSSTSSERERIEVPAFRNKLEFFAAAKISSSFPPSDLPEIAFAGRSNVGKSSLLNALTRQWGVARTSDKPGLTQTINFFKLGQKLCLVDLPGYGFAYAKEEAKEAWEELVKEYVTTRAGLKRVCLLVDTKWGMKPRDHELIDLMERSQTKYQVVLTKTDLVFPIDVARRAMQIEENLKAKKSAVQPVMMVSSKTGAGIRTLRTVLANVSRLLRH